MSARTVTVVTCARRDCDASYVKDTAWAAHQAWAAGWGQHYRRRTGQPMYWFDLCPTHNTRDED